MNLDDLPLEDLATGLFPRGAYLTGPTRIGFGSAVETEAGVADVIHKFRTDALQVISRIEVGVQRHQPHDELSMKSMIRIVHRTKLNVTTGFPYALRREAVIHAYDLPVGKPFLIKLPKWLTYKTMYDAVDLEHSLVNEFRVELDQFEVVEARMWVQRDIYPSGELIHLRVTP